MCKFLASICSVMVAMASTSNVSAADPSLVRTINVSLSSSGDGTRAVIWVADGTRFSELAAVADAATKTGIATITLSVEPKGSDPVPKHVSGDQHIGIQLSAEHAELYVSSGVPYAFIQALSNNLQQLPNVSDVMLRSVSAKFDETRVAPGFDPFGSSAKTSVAPKANRTKSEDPFGG